MIFITFYIIGAILAFLLVAWDNDKNGRNLDLSFILYSWFTILVYIGIFFRSYKPTLKIFKRNKK